MTGKAEIHNGHKAAYCAGAPEMYIPAPSAVLLLLAVLLIALCIAFNL